jgi:hypothetical protein
MDYICKSLCRAEPGVIMNLIEPIVNSKCCSEDTLRELVRTPRMRQYLKPCETQLRLFLGLHLRSAHEKSEQAQVQAPRRSYVLLVRYNS